MKKGDVLLFYGGNDFIDKEIEHYENSMFTHAAVAANDTELVEAWWEGVRISTLAEKGKFATFELAVPPDPADNYRIEVEMYARGCVGKHYNYPGILGFLVRKYLKLKHNPFGSKHSLWCSQLVYEAYLAAGINLIPGIADEDVTPADLANSPMLRRID